MLQIDILTLFPGMFRGALEESIIKRSRDKKLVRIGVHNLRDYTKDKHKKVDDKPYGGGPGMILLCQPIFDAIETLAKSQKSKVSAKGGSASGGKSQKSPPKADPPPAEKVKSGTRVILLSPRGEKFDQGLANRLAKERHLILICGRYEGVDERVKKIVTDEISIGDYVLTGGEIPAMVLVDAVARLVPGVLGNSESPRSDSFQNGLLEYPQYTRPSVYKGIKVPEVLLSGNHARIGQWRYKEAVKNTRKAGTR